MHEDCQDETLTRRRTLKSHLAIFRASCLRVMMCVNLWWDQPTGLVSPSIKQLPSHGKNS